MIRNIIVNASLLLGLAGATFGCSRAQVVCDLICECEHCNDQDELVTCDQLATQEEVASAYDCSEDWEALTVCYEERGTCDENEARYSVEDDNGDNRCADEEQALAECIDAASAHDGVGNF